MTILLWCIAHLPNYEFTYELRLVSEHHRRRIARYQHPFYLCFDPDPCWSYLHWLSSLSHCGIFLKKFFCHFYAYNYNSNNACVHMYACPFSRTEHGQSVNTKQLVETLLIALSKSMIKNKLTPFNNCLLIARHKPDKIFIESSLREHGSQSFCLFFPTQLLLEFSIYSFHRYNDNCIPLLNVHRCGRCTLGLHHLQCPSQMKNCFGILAIWIEKQFWASNFSTSSNSNSTHINSEFIPCVVVAVQCTYLPTYLPI